MKIERGKLKKGASEVPSDCAVLIERLKSCSEDELLRELSSLRVWNWGKCELLHWIDVLDRFDGYLAEACGASYAQTGAAQNTGFSVSAGVPTDGGQISEWVLPCDAPENEGRRRLLIAILQFTALLIEHSFSRHLYNSMEHLTRLLASSDMRTVLAVLNLLYVFSKRSNFITRLCAQRRQLLLDRLTYLAENWGGRENGFGLADCCRPRTVDQYPTSATTLHFEYHPVVASANGRASSEQQHQKSIKETNGLSNSSGSSGVIHVERVDTLAASAGRIMADLMEQHPGVPEGKRMLLFTHLRLAHAFASYPCRLQCVQARLQALSILVYCSAIQENVNALLYNGLIDELVDVLELQLAQGSIQNHQHPATTTGQHIHITGHQTQEVASNISGSNSSCFEEGNWCGSDPMDEGTTEGIGWVATGESEMESLIEIKAAALRTLTAIIHLDGNPKLAAIIATTGATSYHGFLPTLVRACIDRLTATSSISSISVAGIAAGTGNTAALCPSGISALPMSGGSGLLDSSGSLSRDSILNGGGGMPNLAFATALFSFLYHLASYESGCEALVSCGMVQSLLAVIEWPGCEPEHVTFVTRAVRVIDLITGLDMAAFQTNGGLQTFIRRLEQEVDICRLDQPFVIPMGSDMDETSTGQQVLATSSSETGATLRLGVTSSPSAAADSIVANLDETSDGTAEAALSLAGSNNGTSFRTPQQPSTSSATSTAASSANSGGVLGSAYNAGCCQAQCFPQRAALLKSMLNFLKKVISDQSAASESNRHLMDGSLPRSLQHIISNCEYYGASLFLLATDVVTVYVFQEPSLLSPLQDKGLTDVVLHALLTKEVPATREVLASLPNVFTALCLNTRGLEAFVQCQPFERILKVLISPDYLPAMRRRRSSEPLGDTAANLGNSMDELMRHQPSLRAPAMSAIVGLLRELCSMGSNPALVCLRTHGKPTGSGGNSSVGEGVDQGAGGRSGGDDEANGASEAIEGEGEGQVIEVSSESDNDDDDGEEERESPESRGTSVGQSAGASTSSVTAGGSTAGASSGRISGAPAAGCTGRAGSATAVNSDNATTVRTTVPLVDYILNVTKFVDAILSNNSTDDHCKEFIRQRAHVPLLRILALPNLPLDFPISPACIGVASVCKSILNLAHEPVLLWEGLDQLNEVVQRLEPLYNPASLGSRGSGAGNCSASSRPAGSILLQELVDARGAELGPQTAPLIHAMAETHAYVVTFVHVCRTGQSDIRRLSVNHWGSELGLRVISTLAQLYLALVWESTLLLSLRSDTSTSNASTSSISGCSGSASVARQQLARLAGIMAASSNNAAGASGLSDATEDASSPMDVDQTDPKPGPSTSPQTSSSGSSCNAKMAAAVKQIQPLLTGASRLGRALAELFGLLVKLCVGSPVRQRRNQQLAAQPAPPSPAAKAIAMALTRLLAQGLSWTPPKDSQSLISDPGSTKSCFTLYICSAGFTSPMLFDERKMPYHLMLHKFVASGGLDAVFQAFEWAMNYWPGGQDGSVDICGSTAVEDSAKNGVSEFADVAGEFLDAWLLLLEKLANPRAVLDSPHVLPSVAQVAGVHQQDAALEPHFNALQYLMHVHRRTFVACTRLWGRRPPRAYGDRMTESLLAILCHLLKGEAIINERLEQKQQQPTKGSTSLLTGAQGHQSTGSGQVSNAQAAMAGDMIPLGGAESQAGAPEALQGGLFGAGSAGGAGGVAGGPFASFGIRPSEMVNSGNTSGLAAAASAMDVQQLVDMGFDRARATAALAQARSLEQAAELLLSDPDAHQPPPTGHFHVAHPSVQSSSSSGVHTVGEESSNGQQGSEVARAGRNSAGDSIGGLGVDSSLGSSRRLLSECSAGNRGEEALAGASIVRLENEKPIDKAAMDSFTQERLLPGVLSLLGALPDSVYRICDLLAVVVARNGPEWRDFALQRLLGEVKARATHLLTTSSTASENSTPGDPDIADSVSDASQRLAVIVHLVTLLFDEMRFVMSFLNHSNMMRYPRKNDNNEKVVF
ncbi:E3 ubiquitin-protein ligase HUWE1-like [Tropilaelaps mercedesae]|uniref:E3 ubiquitin-protein ligase HUWE1-like n=1 Tax=Tropilaelaps mercedesae TaxID=418985 RepID=A0A1V9Y2I4_9ACAR|nr:E3 ubiquitin-protein ligase HUWE1-like [Tropilaelaps mercedesae]